MDRTKLITDSFKENKIDAFLVRNVNYIRYLTGFSGSAAVCLITKDAKYFISDFRYKLQASQEVQNGYEVIIYTQNSLGFLSKFIKKHNLKRIGFEAGFVTVGQYEAMKSEFLEAKFIPVSGVVESTGLQKNEHEIELTKKAVAITDKTFAKLLTIIKPGMTEREVGAEISYYHKKFGADSDSFDAIVAAGERSAFPHARATDRKIGNNELLKLDFGCTVEGMKSDMTRTIAIGEIPAECKKIYNIVKEAQQRALDAVKSGVSVKKVDAAARDYIKSKGYGDNFGHGTGHGVGYDIHEAPSLNPRTNFKLQVNNIVTIEPGIYIQGLGGVRIEDDVVVTKDGCEILNKTTKDLIKL